MDGRLTPAGLVRGSSQIRPRAGDGDTVTQPAVRVRAGRPTGIERPYSQEELIVSKTDRRGIIRYANDVFIRVSGFSEDELVGRPHNVIRHPDMPHAVFKLMWQALEAGDEIFAYVNNLATDGGHYWVLAHLTSSVDAAGRIVGYHSNRRWVEPEIRREVGALYATIRAAERRERHTPAALAAGLGVIEAHLAHVGLTYEQLVWSIAGRTSSAAR